MWSSALRRRFTHKKKTESDHHRENGKKIGSIFSCLFISICCCWPREFLRSYVIIKYLRSQCGSAEISAAAAACPFVCDFIPKTDKPGSQQKKKKSEVRTRFFVCDSYRVDLLETHKRQAAEKNSQQQKNMCETSEILNFRSMVGFEQC